MTDVKYPTESEAVNAISPEQMEDAIEELSLWRKQKTVAALTLTDIPEAFRVGVLAAYTEFLSSLHEMIPGVFVTNDLSAVRAATSEELASAVYTDWRNQEYNRRAEALRESEQ